MRYYTTTLLCALAGSLAAAAPAAAQQPVTAVDSAQYSMRTALRMLATVQEIHYSQHYTYSRDVDALRAAGRPGSVPADVLVKVVFASDQGHGMVATHPLLPGQSCVMWVGAAEAAAEASPLLVTLQKQLKGVERRGRVTCDFDDPSSAP
jgi:hypothetical protein